MQHKFIERCKETAQILKKRIDMAKARREEVVKQRLAAAALEREQAEVEEVRGGRMENAYVKAFRPDDR